MEFKEKEIIVNSDEAVKLYIFTREDNQPYIIPPILQPKKMNGREILWLLDKTGHISYQILIDGKYEIESKKKGTLVKFSAKYLKKEFNGYPNCDFMGNIFFFDFEDGKEFEYALSRFYWDSILCEVAERTVMRKKKKIREGYVLSTLKVDFYGGTYPAVDHEFHIKGRLSLGGELELAVVRRMMELNFRIMEGDKKKLYRSACSQQPNGKIEYRVTRRSMDNSEEAVMFLLTGNIEIIEEMYLYYCATKDKFYLSKKMELLRKSAEYIESFIEKNGRLQSQVFYEDQVMKDGAVAQAQAFAYNAFMRMGDLERIIGNNEYARKYDRLAEKLKENYTKDLPEGYWDKDKKRYIDWFDKKGRAHDHIHLLSNALPVLYGFDNKERTERLDALIKEHDNIFQKFPSFLAAKIEDYTDNEIGSGGPYDLCAAGRYWCHDAKYRKATNQNQVLKNQLLAVKNEAKNDDFYMGERYDMNYVYYQDKKNWHGSPLYYEYPNTFANVLINDYLGVCAHEKADVLVAPSLVDYGSVRLDSYGIFYEYNEKFFAVTNLNERDIEVSLDLSHLPVKNSLENHIIKLLPNEKAIVNFE